jgi:acyl carrier protein phosphodiesterase
MNYLAHAYLSFNNPQLLLGNIISDFVKGKQQYNYTIDVQKGIQLHRYIDRFTDTHEATKAAAAIFKPVYRLYATAFIDVVYDHFLALDKSVFLEADVLHAFTQQVYEQLQVQAMQMPPRFEAMFHYMKQENWLFHYRDQWGIQRSFEGVVRRAAYLSESDTAFKLFEAHYDKLKECYDRFFPSVKNMAFLKWQELRKS